MNDIEYTFYRFGNCIGAYFGMATSDARKLLPPHLHPLEVQHSRSVLSLTVFEFTESLVGLYNEVVLAVIVPPLVEPGKPLPKSGFYPFVIGTSTEASREHAMERWHLPHYMNDLDIEFSPVEDGLTVSVLDAGTPVLDLTVTQYEFGPSKNLYNAFMTDGDERFKANIYMEGSHSEHEEERGSLTLYEHPMTDPLTLDEVDSYPFREEWYSAGVQTFEPLETL